MMMYQYKDKDASSISAVRLNKLTKQKNLKSMLDDAAEGTVNIDDLYLRKLRKMIKKATVAAGEDHDFLAVDN